MKKHYQYGQMANYERLFRQSDKDYISSANSGDYKRALKILNEMKKANLRLKGYTEDIQKAIKADEKKLKEVV